MAIEHTLDTQRCKKPQNCHLMLRALLVIALYWLPLNLFSEPPVAFSSAQQCPSGYTCGDPILGPGFFQQVMTNINDPANPVTYVRTDINGEDPLNSFSAVSFILQGTDNGGTTNGNANTGISTLQTYDSNFSMGAASGSATINKGWADNAAVPEADILINQNVNSAAYQGTSLNSDFQHQVNVDADGVVTGTATDIRQDIVNTSDISGAPTPATGTDAIAFVHRLRGGDFVPIAGSQVLRPGTGAGMMGGGAGGGTFSWSAGDTIVVTYIGQICVGCPDVGGMGMGGVPADTLFAFMSYDNLTNAAVPISSSLLDSTAPFDWATDVDNNFVFGAIPLGP